MRSATLVAVVPGPRRRVLAAAGLWVGVAATGCSGQPVSAPQGRPVAAVGSMVPAATHEAALPSVHLSRAEAPSPDERSKGTGPGDAKPATENDPRAVPPDTSPAVARVFQRLPVAIHDGAPLGAIGATGIHVDKIWLGTAYEKDGCADETANFSLARDSQVNVCFRVVHSREEESVEVEWIKDGAVFRRRAVNIPDLHAYRSRAYLVLRREYIGAWQGRVRSADGAVLASVDFTVSE